MGLAAAAYGVLCYAVFLGSFLYTIGFLGNIVVPKTIDSPSGTDLPAAVVIDLLLLGLFAVQHSVMARPGFKAVWTRIVPRAVERSTYVLFASLLLALICWQWRSIPSVIWDVDSPTLKSLLLALYALGWVLVLLSTCMTNHFDLFGLRQVYFRLRGRDYIPLGFTERALYKFVRHPIYLGFIIAFWATPRMSAGHLVFSIVTTAYILFGISLEERDLMKYHPVDYDHYRARVPMLLPGTKTRAIGGHRQYR